MGLQVLIAARASQPISFSYTSVQSVALRADGLGILKVGAAATWPEQGCSPSLACLLSGSQAPTCEVWRAAAFNGSGTGCTVPALSCNSAA